MSAAAPLPAFPRGEIHYWKCDRPAAFHGLAPGREGEWGEGLLHALRSAFPGEEIEAEPGGGQGNHPTFLVRIGGRPAFARLEDGAERDDYMDVESLILEKVGARGIPAPRVLAVDCSRREVPFAWQLLERIPDPDLNRLRGEAPEGFPLERLAGEIGAHVARWQGIAPRGFGPFRAGEARAGGVLSAFHADYETYYSLHLERHLRFLAERGLLARAAADEIAREIDAHRGLLRLGQGCLVHKDLALWNILGTADRISAFIDWDDAVSGDPMDDLSLLGCFHDGPFLARLLEGYASVRPLPADHRARFWLHLLRNMLVKAVIRTGAGYFERSGGFFLLGASGSGEALREFTLKRIGQALDGLRRDADPCRL